MWSASLLVPHRAVVPPPPDLDIMHEGYSRLNAHVFEMKRAISMACELFLITKRKIVQ